MIGKIYLTEGAAIGNKSTRFIETSTDWKSVKVGRKFHRQELETILIDLKDFRIKRARSIDEYSSGLMERNYLSRSRNCFETFFFYSIISQRDISHFWKTFGSRLVDLAFRLFISRIEIFKLEI